MTAVPVRLGQRSYEIQVGDLERSLAQVWARRLSTATKALVVTSASVHRAGYAKRAAAVVGRKGVSATVSVIPDGEAVKTLATVHRLYGEALRAGLDRKSVVIAVGGG